MNKFLWTSVALFALIAGVQSLTCNSCPFGVSGTCFFSTTKTCSASEQNCFAGNASFNATSAVTLQSKGCLASASCNQTSTGSILTFSYSATSTCCSSDRCNGASTISIPMTTALGAALLAVWCTRDH